MTNNVSRNGNRVTLRDLNNLTMDELRQVVVLISNALWDTDNSVLRNNVQDLKQATCRHGEEINDELRNRLAIIVNEFNDLDESSLNPEWVRNRQPAPKPAPHSAPANNNDEDQAPVWFTGFVDVLPKDENGQLIAVASKADVEDIRKEVQNLRKKVSNRPAQDLQNDSPVKTLTDNFNAKVFGIWGAIGAVVGLVIGLLSLMVFHNGPFGPVVGLFLGAVVGLLIGLIAGAARPSSSN